MYMIFVCPYLYVSDFVTLLNLETYLLQSFFHIFGQHFSSVLYRTNEVVQHQILVMTFYDMFGHSSIIPPPPRSRAARKSFLLYQNRTLKTTNFCLKNGLTKPYTGHSYHYLNIYEPDQQCSRNVYKFWRYADVRGIFSFDNWTY